MDSRDSAERGKASITTITSGGAPHPTRRTVLTTLASGAGALALAACGAPARDAGSANSSASTAPVKISFWARGTQEFTDMMGAIAKAYTQANPHITVEGGYFPSDGYTDRLVTAAASDTLPDVYHQDSQNVVSLANKGVAADVAPLLAKDGKVKKSDFFPWAFLRAEKDGKTYAMPFKGTCNVMYVNHSLFERAGVALPRAGWTWADYVQAARKLTQDPTTPSGTWGGWSYDWRAAVWQNGGDVVDKTGKTAMIADAASADAIQWMADLALKERVHPQPAEGADLRTLPTPFTSGRIGMFAGGEPDFGAILKVTDFKWGAAPLPLAAAGKPQASFGASTLYSLSPKTKVQAPAWTFLAWIATHQTPQSILNEAAKLGVPPYKPIYESLFLKEPRTDVKKVLGEMANANHPYLEGLTVVPQVEKIFTDELKTVWAGQSTARDATKRIADQITPLLNS
jgi:multiple sugar transport system substrate-binding protein